MRLLRRGAFALLFTVGLALPVHAETLVERINETRTHLYFKVADSLAHAVLPTGWQAAPVPQGPAKGANLILVLIDRVLATDAERKPLEPATNRLLVLVVPGKDPPQAPAGRWW